MWEKIKSQMPVYLYMAMALLVISIFMWATPAHAVKQDVNNNEAFCLAQNIYFEAGNQPLAGKIGVALVTLNRVKSEQFPNTFCEVVYQTKEYRASWKTGELIPKRGMCQFSWYCDGKSDEPKDSKTWVASQQLANQFLLTQPFDLTEGAMWYHGDYIYPYWAQHLNETVHINEHIFYK